MAITANQIDETIVRIANDMHDLQIQVQVFVKNFSQFTAAGKTAIKTYVSNKCTTSRNDLQDVIDAINALP